MKDDFPICKSEQEWSRLLSTRPGGAEPGAFEVTRRAATERPFSGKYNDHWAPGTYRCICCQALLFSSTSKFDAHCGWPSFSQEASAGAIVARVDTSLGMERVETLCAQCGAHLGHVFADGPEPTGLRYCMNSAALDFEPGP